ncbi:sodium/solute symporter [uncultured Gimesia sp.]|uniref:sodium:solute symporter family transporter n=1 Tax=uncultured Gimesia sp. TaxID=1678688 RepID=UPI0026205D0A|nr:sodium/solute symporter [uncultured Gimesia sp.]
MQTLASLDYAIILAYLIGTLALGLYIGSKIKTGSDYFLAGRRLPWWAIGMSLVATDIGAVDIVGTGGAAHKHGLVVGNFEWIGCVPAMIIGAFVFIPFFWRSGVTTIPEYMERRFNVSVRSALAICWILFMACNLGIMLLASAKMMAVHLGMTVDQCIYLTAFLVGIYTISGGLAAVVYTDMIQCIVMIGGCLLVLVLGIIDLGGIDQFQTELKKQEHVQQMKQDQKIAAEEQAAAATNELSHTSLILPADSNTPFPWTGIFFGLALILSPAYWIGNQAIVQRSLGARSEFDAKAAYVWGALLKNLIPVVVAVPGLIAFVKFPELKDGDQAFPELISYLLPVGLKGLFLAAFLAALMSSIDSYLNSASTIVTNDFYKRFYRKDASDKSLLMIGRMITFLLVVWAIGFAFFLKSDDAGIYTIFQTLMSFFQGPAFAILITGLLWKRATGIAAFIGFVVGVCFSILLFTLNQESVCAALGIKPLFQISDPFLYLSIWAFVVSFSLIVIISFLTKPEPAEKIEGLVFGTKSKRRPA